MAGLAWSQYSGTCVHAMCVYVYCKLYTLEFSCVHVVCVCVVQLWPSFVHSTCNY